MEQSSESLFFGRHFYGVRQSRIFSVYEAATQYQKSGIQSIGQYGCHSISLLAFIGTDFIRGSCSMEFYGIIGYSYIVQAMYESLLDVT